MTTNSAAAELRVSAPLCPSASVRALFIALGFGALAVALPFGFHGLGLGRAWMPMYLPLLLLPFLVRPALATAMAAAAPLVSWAVFGMPAMDPNPVALAMAFELATMVGVSALLSRRLPAELACLAGVVVGRGLAVLLLGRHLATGWQGLLVALVAVSLVVRLRRKGTQVSSQNRA